MSGYDVLVLGTLEVHAGDRRLRISGRRQRALLACLVLARGERVPTSELVASIYGEDSGDAAVHSLHELVSSLRRSLEPAGLDALLHTVDGGYRFALDAERVDALRFEKLVEQATAETDSGARRDLLGQALALWRGAAIADAHLDRRSTEAERLEELRRSALADWVDLELDEGRTDRAIAALERARGSNPLDERLAGQLMLALYRESRQADALAVYREVRTRLADELGLEPAERLRTLERRILNHDRTLLAPETPPLRAGPGRRRRPVVLLAAVVAAATATAIGAERALTHERSHAVFADDLSGREIDTRFWDVATFGDGPTVRPDRDGVRLAIPAHAAPTDPSGALKARLASYCTLAGEFDVQVDYRLHSWPRSNGASVGMYAAYADVVRSSTGKGERYVGAHRLLDPPDGPPHAGSATDDEHGALRIVRSGGRMATFVRKGNEWRRIFSFGDATPAAVSVYLELWTNARRFAHRHVEVQLSDFRVNEGLLQCR